jgi:hypothetical protein
VPLQDCWLWKVMCRACASHRRSGGSLERQ